MPLYQLIHHLQSKQDHAPFASKAVSVFKTKLCNIKKVRGGEEEGEGVLFSIFEHLLRPRTIVS